MVHILLVLQVSKVGKGQICSECCPRNDMDTVGVRAGCTLTAYSDSSFNGDRIDIKADTYDRLALIYELPHNNCFLTIPDGLCLLTMLNINTWTMISSLLGVFVNTDIVIINVSTKALLNSQQRVLVLNSTITVFNGDNKENCISFHLNCAIIVFIGQKTNWGSFQKNIKLYI